MGKLARETICFQLSRRLPHPRPGVARAANGRAARATFALPRFTVYDDSMKISSLLWLLPLALLALIVYVSASAFSGAQRPPEKAPVADDPHAAAFPRTIVENGGRKVTIAARPM